MSDIATVEIVYPTTADAIARLRADYLPLVVAGEDDKAGYKTVDKARIHIKKLRCEVENRRKELKADSLAYGRKVDDVAKLLTAPLTEIEDHLERQLKIVDDAKKRREEAERKALDERFDRRNSQLAALGWPVASHVLRSMSDPEFGAVLAEATAAREAKRREEEEAKAKRERFAARVRELGRVRAEIPVDLDGLDDDAYRSLLTRATADFEAAEAARKAESDRLAKLAAELAVERERLVAQAPPPPPPPPAPEVCRPQAPSCLAEDYDDFNVDDDFEWPEDAPALDDDVEPADEPHAPSCLDRFRSLSHERILGAFIFPDAEVSGRWIAYAPSPTHSFNIDLSNGAMEAVVFHSRPEAMEWVADTILKSILPH